MVNSRNAQLDETFFALSDPTRRAMLSRLSRGASSVKELSEPFEMSQPSISKHLRVLERAGLVKQMREGRIRRCELCAGPLQEAATWVESYRRFWEGQLDHLAQYLEKAKPEEQS